MSTDRSQEPIQGLFLMVLMRHELNAVRDYYAVGVILKLEIYKFMM